MKLMNRLLNKTNNKDKFIIETLLPYLVKYIEESEYKEETIEQVKSMCVFPYKDIDGTRLGCLNEPGIIWFFNKDNKKDMLSSSSYRIIDLTLLTESHAKEFRKTFHECCGIEEFSDTAIIDDLLKKMSEETEYSSQWWLWAYDLFKLWKENDYSSLKKATINMKNKSFLFLKKSYSWHLRDKMLEYNVVEDIFDNTANSNFWNKLKTNSDKIRALEMLKGMGVPHELITDKGLNSNIINFFEAIGEEIEFPVICRSKDYDKCELCNNILLELYKNNPSKFQTTIYDSYLIEDFIVKNINNEFVPLSWDLFYSKYELKDVQKEDVYESKNYPHEKTNNPLEIHHIDVSLYEKAYLDLFDNIIHDFTDVNEKMEEYSLGIEVEELDFYKWIWNYSHHDKLIRNILLCCSDQKVLSAKEDIIFVLKVLNRENIEYEGYRFDFELDIETAFEYRNVINRINKEFTNIKCKVEVNGEKFDKNKFIRELTQSINDVKEYQKIVTNEIWDRVYIVGREDDRFCGKYVCCKDEDGETEILLWKSQYNESYIKGLACFISEFFGVEISKIDWKKEYINLIKGIRSIINKHYDVIPYDEVYKFNIDLNDIENFEEEKNLWLRLKEQRKKFIEYDGEEAFSEIVGNRSFLEAKYNGRCQLCHHFAPKNVQDSYFYTYRIIKKSENLLCNLDNNLFCLCPTCHGELDYGSLMGQDMSDIEKKAKEYVNYLEDKIKSDEMGDNFPCLVQELVDKKEKIIKGFHNPIICNVTVNGKERKMVFSWEHFIKIAFIFSDINNFDE